MKTFTTFFFQQRIWKFLPESSKPVNLQVVREGSTIACYVAATKETINTTDLNVSILEVLNKILCELFSTFLTKSFRTKSFRTKSFRIKSFRTKFRCYGLIISGKIITDKIISGKIITDKIISDKIISGKIITDKIISNKIISDKKNVQ